MRFTRTAEILRCLFFIEWKNYRQCIQAQTSAANGTKAKAYLSLKVSLVVLCRKTFMPSKPPGHPPSAPNNASENSDTRRFDPEARHLSKPNAVKVTAFSAVNQIVANESIFLTGGNVLAFRACFGV
jgi:hypothetical protein